VKAGIFRHAEAAAAASGMVVAGDEVRREDTVEISSDNSGPVRSRSEEDFDGEGAHEDDDDENNDDGDGRKKKKRKYHRHTVEQIREMEAYVNSLSVCLRISLVFH